MKFLFIISIMVTIGTSSILAKVGYFCKQIESNHIDEKQFLKSIVHGCQISFLKYLKSGNKLEVFTERGVPALSYAIYFGQYKFANMMIDAGVDLSIVGNSGPLETAIMVGRLQLAEKMLDKGANPNLMNNSQTTPMQEATLFFNASALRLLIRYGGRISVSDIKFSLTLDVLQFYEANGATLQFLDEQNKTLLHYVADRCYHPIWKDGMDKIMPEEQRQQICIDMIEYLLKAGLNPNAKDANGKMPIDYLEEIFNKRAARILREAMKKSDNIRK